MGAPSFARLSSGAMPAIAVGFALLVGASTSEAQAVSRLSGRLEGGGSLLVSSPQSNQYGFGFAGRLELGIRVAGPAHVRAFGQFMNWPSASTSAQPGADGPGQALLLGAGLSIEPQLASRVRLRADLDLGVSLNGAGGDARFTWGLGVGAWFGLADIFDLGPIVRFGSILAAGSEDPSNNGPGSAYFITFGLGIALHGAEEHAAPPPPDETLNHTFTAPPEPVATTVLPAVAPVVAPTPVAPPVQFEVAPPPPAPTPVVEAPPPPAAPAVAEEEEEGGRHGRHGRHGRRGHGGRHGGGGGRHGGGGHHGGGHRRHH
jgi:hypothetical protein